MSRGVVVELVLGRNSFLSKDLAFDFFELALGVTLFLSGGLAELALGRSSGSEGADFLDNVSFMIGVLGSGRHGTGTDFSLNQFRFRFHLSVQAQCGHWLEETMMTHRFCVSI